MSICPYCKTEPALDYSKPGNQRCTGTRKLHGVTFQCSMTWRVPCKHEHLTVDPKKYDPFTLYRNDDGKWTSYYGDCSHCGELWTRGKPSNL